MGEFPDDNRTIIATKAMKVAYKRIAAMVEDTGDAAPFSVRYRTFEYGLSALAAAGGVSAADHAPGDNEGPVDWALVLAHAVALLIFNQENPSDRFGAFAEMVGDRLNEMMTDARRRAS